VAQAIARRATQVVEVAVGQSCQPLKLRLAVNLKLSLENMPRGRTAESLVRLVDGGQQLDVRRGIVALVAGPRGGLGGDPSAGGGVGPAADAAGSGDAAGVD